MPTNTDRKHDAIELLSLYHPTNNNKDLSTNVVTFKNMLKMHAVDQNRTPLRLLRQLDSLRKPRKA